MDELKISIIMPVYNAEKYLAQTLDSVLGQSYENWELICVDDYSEDSSKLILQKYAKKDSRVQFASNFAEKGTIPVLQTGEKNATGYYITRMDADDLMPKSKLKTLESCLSQIEDRSIVSGKVKYFTTSGVLQDGYHKYELWINNNITSRQPYRNIYLECVLPSSAWLMKKNDFDSIGGFSNLNYPEDYHFLFRCYENGIQIKGVSELVHYWRDHPERTSRNSPWYADQLFLDLKIPFFIKLDLNRDKQLVLWGAGKKGKRIAQKLIEYEIDFIWVTDNSKKIGHIIYGIGLNKPNIDRSKFQYIIAVSNPQEFSLIQNKLLLNSLKLGLDYFQFC